MRSDFLLELDERLVFRSKRGGTVGYSSGASLLIFFVASQILGALITLAVVLGGGVPGQGIPPMTVMSILTVVIAVALIVLWIRHVRAPAYFITDRKIVARRFLLAPITIDLANVGGVSRIVVRYTRYGRVVSEVTTNRVVVALGTGGVRRFGPVEDAEEFVALLRGVMQGAVDPRALPDLNGGLARAEERSDLFLALSSVTAGVTRGPVFVGPTKVIGFADVFYRERQYQVLTIVGASRSAADVEQAMLDLAQREDWGRGRAVVMDREGTTLLVEESPTSSEGARSRLVLASADHSVGFELHAKDAERARQFTKAGSHHPYRG